MDLEQAHAYAFKKLQPIIDKRIIRNREVATISELRLLYIDFLSETSYPNPNYRHENLKNTILSCEKYEDIIAITNPKQFTSSIVYN